MSFLYQKSTRVMAGAEVGTPLLIPPTAPFRLFRFQQETVIAGGRRDAKAYIYGDDPPTVDPSVKGEAYVLQASAVRYTDSVLAMLDLFKPRTMRLLAGIIVCVQFARTALALTLPVGQQVQPLEGTGLTLTNAENDGSEWWEFDASMALPPGYQVRVTFGSVSLNEQDLYLATLYCASIYAADLPDAEITPASVCGDPHHNSVKIKVDMVPNPKLRFNIVTGIAVAAEAIVRRNSFKRAIAKFYHDNALLGTLTFVQGSEVAVPSYIDTVKPAQGLQSTTSKFTMSPDGSLAEAGITIKNHQIKPPPNRASDADSLRLEINDNDENYYLHVKSTAQKGLSLQAYTMAAIKVFQDVVEAGVDPKTAQVDFQTSAWEPFQQPRRAGFDIKLLAGLHGEPMRREAPIFTLYAIALAIREVPLIILDGGKPFDFFTCEIFADREPRILLGYIWTQPDGPPDIAEGVENDPVPAA